MNVKDSVKECIFGIYFKYYVYLCIVKLKNGFIMLEIIKIRMNNDAVASRTIEVMFCSSFEECEQKILNDLNCEFGEKWESLDEVVTILDNDLSYVNYDKDTFVWDDNGQSCSYVIGKIVMFWQYRNTY